MPNFGLRMSEPLAKDTVSFKATPKVFLGRTSDIPMDVIKRMQEDAVKRQPRVAEYMNTTFAPLLVTADNQGNIIYKITDRVKSLESFWEKIQTNKWQTEEEVREKCTDLNAARFILRDGSREGVKATLDILSDSIKKRQIILKQIENKRPKDVATTEHDYADPKWLRKLCALSERVNPTETVDFLPDEISKTNYPALHLLLQLPGEDWVFEVQLIGYDVALYKELDDIIFKIFGNKKVDKKYKKLVDILKPLNEPENAKIQEQFNKYRANVFLFQKIKEPYIRKDNTFVERFLPVSNEIKDNEMREILDMNNLYSIYQDCLKKQNKTK